MYNESKELLWETFLKSAVIENNIKELNTYPDSKDLKNIQIPKNYDYKMRKLINRLNFQRKFLSALHVAQKAVSIILIITGASFIFLLQNHDVRAACKNFITKIYEQYINATREFLNEFNESNENSDEFCNLHKSAFAAAFSASALLPPSPRANNPPPAARTVKRGALSFPSLPMTV